MRDKRGLINNYKLNYNNYINKSINKGLSIDNYYILLNRNN